MFQGVPVKKCGFAVFFIKTIFGKLRFYWFHVKHFVGGGCKGNSAELFHVKHEAEARVLHGRSVCSSNPLRGGNVKEIALSVGMKR